MISKDTPVADIKLAIVAAVALFALAATAKTAATETLRKPAASTSASKAVTLKEKAPICHAIQARYQSTTWPVCSKIAKFSRQKDQIRVSLKTKKGPLKCRADLRPHGRFFDVTRMKCD